MKRWLLAAMIGVVAVSGCSRSNTISKPQQTGKETAGQGTEETIPSSAEAEPASGAVSAVPGKERVKVKGIYISGFMAGAEGLKDILDQVDRTEINAVIIDVKNDDGRITYAMDSPTVNEIDASEAYIRDIHGLMADLKSRGIYTIARIVAFRDPYLAEKKPEWSLKDADGSLHRDKQGLAWVNPYKREVWDYLVEVGAQAADIGFDEIQFDYIRFSTDSTMKDVVFEEADTKGRSRTDVITEFVAYAYEKLSEHNVFVAADVFGTIIGSRIDADAVGQVYSDMAKNLDYICPMIYPSHYGDGNFGIEHPDTQPYDTIYAALRQSRQDLRRNNENGEEHAVVRPWLQDFTASYLQHHITYGPEELRAQIQAVYDAGYDEWILWSASNQYTWDGLLTQEDAKAEEEKIKESREALAPEETEPQKGPKMPKADQESVPESGTAQEPETALEESAKETLPDAAETGETQSTGRRKPGVVIITTGADGAFQ